MSESSVDKWDIRFLDLAKLVSTWSKDPSTKVGAVIVAPDKRIVSTGFNGFAQNMGDIGYLYANREEKYSRIIHAEMNAVMFARESLRGCTMYSSLAPCDRCFVHMLQLGITRFVAPKATEDQLTRWGAAFERVRTYAREAQVELNELDY